MLLLSFLLYFSLILFDFQEDTVPLLVNQRETLSPPWEENNTGSVVSSSSVCLRDQGKCTERASLGSRLD